MKRTIRLFLLGITTLSVVVTIAVFLIRTLSYSPPVCDGCNVILITLDATTADAFSRSDSPFVKTKTIAEKSGISFDYAYAPAVFSYPGVVSLLTGFYPWKLSIWDYHATLKPETATLAETLSSYGYETAGFVRGPFMSSEWGLQKGFGTWRTGDPTMQEPMRVSFDEAKTWIEKNKEVGPYFVYIKPFSVYDLFSVPDASSGFTYDDLKNARSGDADAAKRVREGYGHAMKEADVLLSSFITDITKTESGRKTMIVLTGTYGQELLTPTDRGEDAVSLPSAESLHVPLVWLIPNQSPRTVHSSVEARSIANTIVHAVSGVQNRLPGTSLTQYFRGKKDDMRVYAYVPWNTRETTPEIPRDLSTIVAWYKKKILQGEPNKEPEDVAYASLEGDWQVIRAGEQEFVFNVKKDPQGKENMKSKLSTLSIPDNLLVRDLFLRLMKAL